MFAKTAPTCFYIIGNFGRFEGAKGDSQYAKVPKLPIDGCGDNDRSSSSSFLEIT